MFPQQPATHPEPHPETEPETHAEPQPATQPEPRSETLAQPQPATQPEPYRVPQPELYQAPQPELYQTPQPELYEAPQPEVYEAPQPELYQAPQPETYPPPQPAPAATDTAGHEVPAWSPPVAVPTEFPPSPPYSPPPAPPGRRSFRILVAVAVVLAAAIAVTATLGWSDVSHLRQGVSNRQAELARTAQEEQAAARKLLDDFRGAGLESKLQRVKDLDKAADAAFRSWRSGTARFGVLDAAMNDCNDAVIAYNSAAGPFPDHLFTTVPRQIDLKNPDTDCGRTFTGSI
jgi:hypothetical protein